AASSSSLENASVAATTVFVESFPQAKDSQSSNSSPFACVSKTYPHGSWVAAASTDFCANKVVVSAGSAANNSTEPPLDSGFKSTSSNAFLSITSCVLPLTGMETFLPSRSANSSIQL